jgi:Glutathione S-transferase
MPDGLLEAARADLRIVYDALDKELAHHQFVSGPLSIADIALFPHVSSAKAMEVNSRHKITPILDAGSRKCGRCRFVRLT